MNYVIAAIVTAVVLMGGFMAWDYLTPDSPPDVAPASVSRPGR